MAGYTEILWTRGQAYGPQYVGTDNALIVSNSLYVMARPERYILAGQLTLPLTVQRRTGGQNIWLTLNGVAWTVVDADGGTFSGGLLTGPPGATSWAPTVNVTAGGTDNWQLLVGGTQPAGTVEFSFLPARIAAPGLAGESERWDQLAEGTTCSPLSVPTAVWSGIQGPWSTIPAYDAAGAVLAVRKSWTGTKDLTIPLFISTATAANVRVTANSGTATLLALGGATDNGDGTLAIPPRTRCLPKWSATDGVKLELIKPADTFKISYSPLYIETAVVPPTPPSITKLIPTSGPDTGGTLVDVIGTDLTGATAVDFGGTPGTGLTVDPSGGLATVTSPAHTAGPAPVTITTPAGTSNAETFTFEAPIPPGLPTLTGIDPTEGPETGGTPALLTGTNLAGTIGVDFGGSPATIITVTDTALLVTTPAHAAGTVDVTATDGATTTDPLAFEFAEATGPVIDGPDVIANLVALLTSELGVPVSSRRSPTATKDSDPSVVVRRTGGPSKGVASDNPTVTIEAWAPTTTESFQLLQSARLVVIEAAEQGRAGLRRYDEFAGPADLPDPSTTNPRHTLTASVVTRLE